MEKAGLDPAAAVPSQPDCLDGSRSDNSTGSKESASWQALRQRFGLKQSMGVGISSRRIDPRFLHFLLPCHNGKKEYYYTSSNARLLFYSLSAPLMSSRAPSEIFRADSVGLVVPAPEMHQTRTLGWDAHANGKPLVRIFLMGWVGWGGVGKGVGGGGVGWGEVGWGGVGRGRGWVGWGGDRRGLRMAWTPYIVCSFLWCRWKGKKRGKRMSTGRKWLPWNILQVYNRLKPMTLIRLSPLKSSDVFKSTDVFKPIYNCVTLRSSKQKIQGWVLAQGHGSPRNI